MKLYVLNDDARGYASHEEDVEWLAIWHNSPDEARRLFLRLSGGDSNLVDVACKEMDVGATPSRPDPHQEQRTDVLRALGWKSFCGSDRSCDTCGLYSMGDDRFEVCEECYQCPQCGCDCEGQCGQQTA